MATGGHWQINFGRCGCNRRDIFVIDGHGRFRKREFDYRRELRCERTIVQHKRSRCERFGHGVSAGRSFGLLGSSKSSHGTGVSASAAATSGATVGLKAQVSSASGTAAIIQNTASGQALSAHDGVGLGTEKFGVDGVGNVTASGAVTSTGNMSGNQLISRIATGTAPLQVTSTTLVPNLNASLLKGGSVSAFALGQRLTRLHTKRNRGSSPVPTSTSAAMGQ